MWGWRQVIPLAQLRHFISTLAFVVPLGMGVLLSLILSRSRIPSVAMVTALRPFKKYGDSLQIPPEILIHILSYLDCHTLLHAQAVCSSLASLRLCVS